ncbi:hypothetical protein [Ruania halotolerans]|uniref:hypothetical protein n=1 Tax=Ruania halotolerans TaxID=2897773 RepID=UPI001E42449D|nr:hypothetical protein [Ruania halotolerans]UFU05783.1 hypothetical protein LQF10_15275 [Ruania halotolerans]
MSRSGAWMATGALGVAGVVAAVLATGPGLTAPSMGEAIVVSGPTTAPRAASERAVSVATPETGRDTDGRDRTDGPGTTDSSVRTAVSPADPPAASGGTSATEGGDSPERVSLAAPVSADSPNAPASPDDSPDSPPSAESADD